MDWDPFSALARAMRACTDVELVRLLEMVEDHSTSRDRERVEVAKAARTLVT